MSETIFTAGAKGGTGKTTAARLLITFLRDRGYDPLLLLDLDDENRTRLQSGNQSWVPISRRNILISELRNPRGNRSVAD